MSAAVSTPRTRQGARHLHGRDHASERRGFCRTHGRASSQVNPIEWLARVGGSRFLQTDPIEGGSANNYDFARQDPLNNSDLNGAWCITGVHHWTDSRGTKHQRCNNARDLLANRVIKKVITVGVGAAAGAACGALAGSLGPLGMRACGAITGAVTAAALDALESWAATGHVNWRGVLTEAVMGAVSGVFGAQASKMFNDSAAMAAFSRFTDALERATKGLG